MELIYPINLAGHDEWMKSGYALDLAGGDVITRDGEVLGSWRVVEYDPEADDEGGRYEFVLNGQDVVMFAEEFAFLDYRTSRGFALSTLTRAIKEWHEAQPTWYPSIGDNNPAVVSGNKGPFKAPAVPVAAERAARHR